MGSLTCSSLATRIRPPPPCDPLARGGGTTFASLPSQQTLCGTRPRHSETNNKHHPPALGGRPLNDVNDLLSTKSSGAEVVPTDGCDPPTLNDPCLQAHELRVRPGFFLGAFCSSSGLGCAPPIGARRECRRLSCSWQVRATPTTLWAQPMGGCLLLAVAGVAEAARFARTFGYGPCARMVDLSARHAHPEAHATTMILMQETWSVGQRCVRSLPSRT